MDPRRLPKKWLALGLLSGIPLGLGLFTFVYAEGASYLSSDPRACVNCHIMRSQYEAWQKGSHHAVATCVDCHLPHDFPWKYVAKARNGYHHSKAFTLQDFPEPIQITEYNAATLQQSCLRCHARLVHELLTDEVRCVHCHASVGHGELAGLGGADRGESAELDDGRHAP
jgi:cytochrome c nitrite reductase small subunit